MEHNKSTRMLVAMVLIMVFLSSFFFMCPVSDEQLRQPVQNGFFFQEGLADLMAGDADLRLREPAVKIRNEMMQQADFSGTIDLDAFLQCVFSVLGSVLLFIFVWCLLKQILHFQHQMDGRKRSAHSF